MKRILREPLFQFFVLGLGLFILNHLWEAWVTRSDYTIHISASELERQAAIFAAENRRTPSDEDIKALLFAHVEEQALMREAERLGLGEDDTIIRRRLAQKMRFMITDASAPKLPSEAELRKWFAENRNLFRQPETRSFSHIYLSPEKHGDAIDMVGANLANTASDENWRTLGDPFISRRQYVSLSSEETAREFGQNFARQVFSLSGEGWSKPIGSAFGLHVVRIDNITRETTPEFDDARARAEEIWRDREQRRLNQKALSDLLEKYNVVVDDLSE